MAGRINDRELITLARISNRWGWWGWFRGFKMERGEGGGEEGVLEDLEEI